MPPGSTSVSVRMPGGKIIQKLSSEIHSTETLMSLTRQLFLNVEGLLRIPNYFSRRWFPKAVASRIGGFDGPWHARVHKFMNDYIHIRVYAYIDKHRHAPTDVPTHADTRRDAQRHRKRDTRTQQLLIVWRILEWPLVMHARWTKNNVFFCTH